MSGTIDDHREDESRDSRNNPDWSDDSIRLPTHSSSLGIERQKIQGLPGIGRMTICADPISRLRGCLTLTSATPSLKA